MNKTDLMCRNVKVYPWFKMFFNLIIIGPILVPFMLWKGLSYAEIMLLQSISAISVFIFEVPTGAIADKVSRKLSLVLSGFFAVFGLLFYILFKSFLLFAVAEILFGIGLTLSSGSDSALLYESLAKSQKKDEYQNHEGHAASLCFIGQAIGGVLSAFLFKYNPNLPFIISIGNLFVAIIFSFKFEETEREKSEHKYVIHVLKSIKISIKTPRILWTVLFAGLMGFVYRTSFWLYQPYFKLADIDIQWFGLIFAYFNIVAAFSSKYLVKKFHKTRPRKIFLVLILIMAGSFLVPMIFFSPFMIIVLASQQIVRGMYRPTLRFYINHQISDKYRATVISLVSLSASLCFAILSPIVGLALDHKGTPFTYVWMGIITLAGTLILWTLRAYQKRKN